MKRGLKKKGASLVAVLVICSILLVTATTMIGVATADVRMRINESKKLQNLYKADSGLDIMKNIISKDVEAAIEYARTKMATSEVYSNAVGTNPDESIYNELNKQFKTIFLRCLVSDIEVDNDTVGDALLNIYKDNSIVPVNSSRENEVINPTNGDNILFYSIKNKRFVTNIVGDTDFVRNGDSYDINISNINATYNKVNFDSVPVFEVVDIKYTAISKSIEITIRSSFECEVEEASSTKLKNKKTIETKFSIVAPEYKEIINRNNSYDSMTMYSPYTNVIAADGNLFINQNSNISGDVWVKGTTEGLNNLDPSIVFSKYAGGIMLANNKNFNMSGNIYTASTFSIVNNSQFTQSNGNLYSNNTYIGPARADDNLSSSNTVSLSGESNMITNNDLAINSLGSKITMNNYYGLSATAGTSNKTDSSKRSGCIIVNNFNNNSELNINNAYINGVAYIDTGDKTGDNRNVGEYETGESIAVKGNYKVYTEVMPGYEDRVTLRYYNPVQLIETIDGENSIEKKKIYFNEYYSKEGVESNNAGITIGGRIFSVGAYVSINKNNEQVISQNEEGVRIISEKQREYARSVLGMNSDLTDDRANYVFNNGNVIKSVKGFENVANSNLVNFPSENTQLAKKSESRFQGSEDPITGNYRYVVNGSTEVVTIGDGYITIGDGTGADRRVEITNNNVEAVIITKGDVIIKSGVNFTGSIISGGNITVDSAEGNEITQISYNAQTVAQIISANELHDYFNTTDVQPGEEVRVDLGDRVSTNLDEGNGYNVKDVVVDGLWKLIK